MNTSDKVAIAALVIALVSLVNAILQFMQQYFLTAEAYRRCQPSIMGPWSKKTHLHFRWKQFRLETHFVIPIFEFKARGKDIQDWQCKTYCAKWKERMFAIIGEKEEARIPRVGGTKYHFTPETVTWLYLLESLHNLDDATHNKLGIPNGSNEHCIEGKQESKDLEAGITQATSRESNIVAGLQFPTVRRWERSWDAIPPDVIRPLAISDLSSIARIAIRLGMAWKQFDVAASCFHALGNGMTIVSTSSRSTATTLQFDSEGEPKVFDPKNLLIPREESDMLAFGIIKPWYEESSDVRSYLVPGEFASSKRFVSFLAGILIADHKALEDDHTSILGDVLPLTACMMRIRGLPLVRIPNVRTLFGPSKRFITGITSQFESLMEYKDYINSLPEKECTGEIPWLISAYKSLGKYRGWRDELGEASDIIGSIGHLDDVQDRYDYIVRWFKRNEAKDGLKYYDLLCAFFSVLEPVCQRATEGIGWSYERPLASAGMKKYLDLESMSGMWEYLVKKKDFTGTVDQVREAFLMMIFRAICWNRCHLLVDRGSVGPEYWNSRLLVYIV